MRTFKLNYVINLGFILLMTGMISCTKSAEKQSSAEVETPKSTFQTDHSKELTSVQFSMDEFEEDFGWHIGFMNRGDVYSLIYDSNTHLLTLTDIGDDHDPLETMVCSGSGLSFVKSVQNWCEDHIGDCLCITYDGSSYAADDACDCP